MREFLEKEGHKLKSNLPREGVINYFSEHYSSTSREHTKVVSGFPTIGKPAASGTFSLPPIPPPTTSYSLPPLAAIPTVPPSVAAVSVPPSSSGTSAFQTFPLPAATPSFPPIPIPTISESLSHETEIPKHIEFFHASPEEISKIRYDSGSLILLESLGKTYGTDHIEIPLKLSGISNDLSEELYRWKLFQILKEKFLEKYEDPKIKEEIEKCLRRWLLMMTVFINCERPNMAPIFTILPIEHSIHQTLLNELKAKIPPENASSLVESAIGKIREHCSSIHPPIIYQLKKNGNEIEYGPFKINLNPYWEKFWSINAERNLFILRSMIRHCTISSEPHCTITPRMADALYREGVRIEAFATPMKSKFLGKTDAKVCTLFLDADHFLQTSGDFFHLDYLHTSGDIFANLPPGKELLSKMMERIEKILEETKRVVYFIFPSMPDEVTKIRSSRFLKSEVKLEPTKYELEIDGKIELSPFECIFFILSSDPKEIKDNIIEAMKPI
jgi:hypothetical protein